MWLYFINYIRWICIMTAQWSWLVYMLTLCSYVKVSFESCFGYNVSFDCLTWGYFRSIRVIFIFGILDPKIWMFTFGPKLQFCIPNCNFVVQNCNFYFAETAKILILKKYKISMFQSYFWLRKNGFLKAYLRINFKFFFHIVD